MTIQISDELISAYIESIDYKTETKEDAIVHIGEELLVIDHILALYPDTKKMADELYDEMPLGEGDFRLWDKLRAKIILKGVMDRLSAL
jgi:hypothetical protein